MQTPKREGPWYYIVDWAVFLVVVGSSLGCRPCSNGARGNLFVVEEGAGGKHVGNHRGTDGKNQKRGKMP